MTAPMFIKVSLIFVSRSFTFLPSVTESIAWDNNEGSHVPEACWYVSYGFCMKITCITFDSTTHWKNIFAISSLCAFADIARYLKFIPGTQVGICRTKRAWREECFTSVLTVVILLKGTRSTNIRTVTSNAVAIFDTLSTISIRGSFSDVGS